MIHIFYLLVNGSSLPLPAYGRVGQGQRFLVAHFAKRNTKNCGGEKRSGESEDGPRRRNFVSLRGKQKFLLFACPVASRRLCYEARPSENYQKSASGFSRKKVRILFKTDSQVENLMVSTNELIISICFFSEE